MSAERDKDPQMRGIRGLEMTDNGRDTFGAGHNPK